MKLTKLASVALSAALLLGAKSAVAQPVGVTFDHLKLQFNLTLYSQNPDINNGKNIFWGYSKVKLTNKDILALLAQSIGTTWPAGAQLEYIFDGYINESAAPKDGRFADQLVVADYTGTNILYLAGDGVDDDFTYTYFDFDPFDTEGVYQGSETATGSAVGQETYGEVYSADFEFYADFNFNNNPDTATASPKVTNNNSGYWDLYGGGSTTETYAEKWSPYTDSGFDNITVALVGGGYYNGNSHNFITGPVLGLEQWNEVNYNQSKFAGVVKQVGHKSAKH